MWLKASSTTRRTVTGFAFATLVISAVVFAAKPKPVVTEGHTAYVTRVSDGDTLKVRLLPSGEKLKVRILGIDSFDAYGRLQGYLRTVGPIQRVDLRRVADGALHFELDVRGDIAQLNDALALQNVLVPVSAPDAAELAYRLVTAP